MGINLSDLLRDCSAVPRQKRFTGWAGVALVVSCRLTGAMGCWSSVDGMVGQLNSRVEPQKSKHIIPRPSGVIGPAVALMRSFSFCAVRRNAGFFTMNW